jgi:guanidinopropionase
MTDNPQPPDLNTMPRFAGVATFMRLPVETDFAKLDIAMAGVPWDGGTTNRAGARHGPREIRNMSSLIRRVNHASGIAPFELCRCGDVGDAPVNPISVPDSMQRIQGFFERIVAAGAVPLSAGGDHLITLPIFRALAAKRPIGMVHFDAHSDTADSYFGGERYTHGTPFRRAVEEGLLDPKRTIQIGIRGSMYDRHDLDFAREAGIRIVTIEELYDIGLDPVYAPGTGTPEIGGFTTHEAQRMIRGLQGLDLIGGDVVEVAPPFDPSGNTAIVGATMMFEILCVLAEARSRRS